MAIALACPSCGARMEYRDEDAGRRGQCPSCKNEVQVPLDTKTCGNCRRNVAVDATSCPACGAAIMPGAATAPWPEMAPAAGPIGPPATSGKAVASLVLGLLSFLFWCFTGLPTIILGALALSDQRRYAGRLKGQGMAVTGIVTGALSLVCAPILAAVLLPAVQMGREAARRTQCRNNLKQIGTALQNYHATYNSFPPAATYDAQGRPLLSWRVLILPFINEQALYNQFHLDEPWDSPHNLPLADQMPEVYSCPSDPGFLANATGYVAITGNGTVFPPRATVSIRDIRDGLSVTAMVGELRSSNIIWTKPDDVDFDSNFVGPGNFSSFHPVGWNLLFADGSVRFIDNNIDPNVCRGFMTIDGREAIGSSDF